MSKYVSSGAMKKIALVSGALALVNGLIGLAVALVPPLAFLACFITPLLCLVGLGIPAWAAYVAVKENGFTKDQITDGLLSGALAGAVSGAVTGTVGAVFGIINTLAGGASSAALTSLGGFDTPATDVAVSTGAGVVGSIICAPVGIIVAILIAAVIGAVAGLLIAAMTEKAGAKPAMASKPAEPVEAKKEEETK
ncbi:MAG: hypothetical protein TR69_WS6001000525 [candidate division WS6 bacterium OLB20]|uniref:Uncharacterized protein n=1 Tax=candidate division WS6 bacterium OLB20 TaxID=1617426 RepID=A0A136LXZ8_9BACT|nr:MAG: hypothetical protein TR69_WS6001000525 [candidate division WS6 bacterium OLB20]